AATSAVAAATGTAPANTAQPTIQGAAQEGQTLTASAGTWAGTAPISFGYQWRRCANGCADLAGATGQTYTPVAADVGATLRVAVTATNSAGSATATSADTASVQAAGGSSPIN